MKNTKLVSKLFDSFESDLINIKGICETLSGSSALPGITGAVNAFTVELDKLRKSIINESSSTEYSDEEKKDILKDIAHQDRDHVFNDPGSMTTLYHFDDDPSNKDNAMFNYMQLINIIESIRKEPFYSLEPIFSLCTNAFEFINSDMTTFGFMNHSLFTHETSNNMIADRNKWNNTVLNVISSNEWKAVFNHYNAFESCVKYNQIDVGDIDICDFITTNAKSLKIAAILESYQEVLSICNINLPLDFQIKPITPWYDII